MKWPFLFGPTNYPERVLEVSTGYKGWSFEYKRRYILSIFYKPTVTRCNPCNLDQKRQEFSISDVILCAELNAAIKKIDNGKQQILKS